MLFSEQMDMASMLLPALLGAALGIAGFLPLLAAISLRRRMGRLAIASGLAAVAVSFAFLMLAEAAVWVLRPEWLLPAVAGMLVAFLALWALLALRASRHGQ